MKYYWRNLLLAFGSTQFKRSLWMTKDGVVNVDRIRIYVQAGNGGQGLPRYNGIGGDGGDVVLVADGSLKFEKIVNQHQSKLKGQNGQNATERKLVGESGRDKVFNIPIGVDVLDAESKLLIARCVNPRQKYILARGGQGARPENCFKASRGERFMADFYFKLQPNVGIIGFPNAGKSTLMKALIPRKKIKIASYPFTTIKPQIGYVSNFDSEDEKCGQKRFSLSIADLPGLIEGSHMNRGRGLEFLKHLKFSDILLMVVDVTGFKLNASADDLYRTALENVALLNIEMEKYDPSMISKPIIVAINKIDLKGGREKAQELVEILSKQNWVNFVDEKIRPERALRFHAIIPIAAREGCLNDLKIKLKELYLRNHPAVVPSEPDSSVCDARLV